MAVIWVEDQEDLMSTTVAPNKTARELTEEILSSPSVRNFTKDVIRMGLDRDCVDAVADIELALAVLTCVMNEALGRPDRNPPDVQALLRRAVL